MAGEHFVGTCVVWRITREPPTLHSFEHLLKELTPKWFGKYSVVLASAYLLLYLSSVCACAKLMIEVNWTWECSSLVTRTLFDQNRRVDKLKFIAMTMTAGLVLPRQPHYCLEMFGPSCETLQIPKVFGLWLFLFFVFFPFSNVAPSNQETRRTRGNFNWAHGHMIVLQRARVKDSESTCTLERQPNTS